MLDQIYETLARIGYHHPIHPPLTHIPVGMVIGAFIFSLLAWIFNRQSLARSARHCVILALLALPVVVLFGLMDWQHFYGGAPLPPIHIKMGLAAVLAVLLLVAWRVSKKEEKMIRWFAVVCGLCLLTVMGLGFFGGDLVYGVRTATAASTDSNLVQQGDKLFMQSCAGCHFADKTATKIGPGFKGLFQRKLMPDGKQPVSEEAIVHQLKSPTGSMPPFPNLSQEQIKALIAYMKTL